MRNDVSKLDIKNMEVEYEEINPTVLETFLLLRLELDKLISSKGIMSMNQKLEMCRLELGVTGILEGIRYLDNHSLLVKFNIK